MSFYEGTNINIEHTNNLLEKSNSNKFYQLKGKDNQYYNINIIFQDKSESIIFNVKPIGDFTELIYTKTLELIDFYNLNRSFRQYLSIKELYLLFFSKINNKDLSISKNKNIINLNFVVLSLNKKEVITINLIEEKIPVEKMIKKLVEKIKEIERFYKIKEEQINLSENTSKKFFYIFSFFIILNIIIILFIYKEKLELNNIKLQIDNEIKTIKFQIKEINNKLNSESYNNENNLDIIPDLNEFSYIDYYIKIYHAFDLVNEGIKKLFNKKIKSYELIFKASKDGFKAKDFHKKCDYKSNTVTFILTKEGKFFGGFTDYWWDSESDAKAGSNGFIFSLNNKEIFYNIDLKFNIRCIADYGPIFWNFDIGISDDCNINNKSYFGSYAYDTKGKEKIFAENKFFCVEDYATYN